VTCSPAHRRIALDGRPVTTLESGVMAARAAAMSGVAVPNL